MPCWHQAVKLERSNYRTVKPDNIRESWRRAAKADDLRLSCAILAQMRRWRGFAAIAHATFGVNCRCARCRCRRCPDSSGCGCRRDTAARNTSAARHTRSASAGRACCRRPTSARCRWAGPSGRARPPRPSRRPARPAVEQRELAAERRGEIDALARDLLADGVAVELARDRGGRKRRERGGGQGGDGGRADRHGGLQKRARGFEARGSVVSTDYAARRPPDRCFQTPQRLPPRGGSGNERPSGRVAEWFKAAVLKTAVGATPPWVRIPPLPPVWKN